MLNHQERLDGIFSALADPTRRAILERLAREQATVSTLAAPFDMSLPAVHQHLGHLERAGLIACEKRGRERWCRLEPRGLDRAERWIGDRKRLWERRLDALEAYLADAETKAPKKRRRR